MKKRALILALAGIIVGSLTGCGSLKDTDVVAEVGNQEITAGEANFYARYVQAQYETYYSAYLGGDDMWTKEGSDGKTYEESVKSTILDELENMLVLEKHMKDYDVSLTKAEKKAVSDAAAEFVKGNSEKKRAKVSGTKENAKRIMMLMTIEQKMRSAIEADADTNVSDDEAAQKSMQYVMFSYKKSSDSSQDSSETVSDKEKKEIKQKAETFAEGAKKADDFSAYATEQGQEAQTATFDADSTSPSADVIKAADKLEEGGTTDVIETEEGCYVARVTSLLDRDATDQKKQSIISDRQTKLYEKTEKKWKKKEDITVHKNVWKKIDFTKLSVKTKVDASTEDTTSGN